MIVPLTQLAEASGPAALGLSLQAFVIQLLTFLIVFLALRKWAFKPITKMLERRRDLIERGVTLGEAMRAREAKLEETVAQKLHEARAVADQILADAQGEAKQKITAAEAAAQKRAESVLQEAEAQISQAAGRERKRLEAQMLELVSDVSQAVIGEKVDPKKDEALVARALQERSSV